MTTMASQITSLTVVYSTVYSDADQKKTSKLRVTGLCVGNSPGPVNSPHKGPVTRKCFHLMTSSCHDHMFRVMGISITAKTQMGRLVWKTDRRISMLIYSIRYMACIYCCSSLCRCGYIMVKGVRMNCLTRFLWVPSLVLGDKMRCCPKDYGQTWLVLQIQLSITFMHKYHTH